MENSNINPSFSSTNLDNAYQYFLSLGSMRPQSLEECQKLRKEATDFFNKLTTQNRENLHNILNEKKIKEPGSLTIGEMFALQREASKLEEIREIFSSSMGTLDLLEDRFRIEDKIKTNERNRGEKDERP